MSEIHFCCPKCNQPIDAPAQLASQLINCPTCREEIEVPIRSVPKKPPPPLPPSNPNLQFCPSCNAEVSRKANTCPQCGHPIMRGFLGKAGTERSLNIGCLILLLLGLLLLIFL